MQPVNLRSMFAIAADVCRKMEEEEEVNMEREAMRIKSIETMSNVFDKAIKLTALSFHEKFDEKWQRFNPQLKNYDALPE